MKVGRNDPCWCGSGKKYKQCHLALDEAAASEYRRLKRAGDALLPRVIELAQQHTDTVPVAFNEFWDGRYTIDQLELLDEQEGRGAERFLTWFAFDYPLEDGKTLVERIAAGLEDITLSEEEQSVIDSWTGVRLQPLVVDKINKGQDIQVRQLLNDQVYTIEDQLASRRVELGEVLIVHLLPLASKYFIGGAAAHLTEDTAEPLYEFLKLHLEALRREQPEATADDLLRTKSFVMNLFVMALPVDEPDPTVFARILEETRAALAPEAA